MSIDKELHRVVTTVIVYTPERKFLIAQRAHHKKVYPGKWNVPGGGLEIDDYVNSKPTHGDQWYHALQNTMRRELREECNIEIGKPEFLLDITFIRPDGIPVLVLSYYAPYVSGEVELLDKDNIDFAWVSAEEAASYDLIEGTLEEIQQVDKILADRTHKLITYNP